MKKILLSIICLFLTYNSYAQMDGNYNYSVGLRGYSLMQFPKILNQTNSQDYVNAYLNGLIIKFNDNQISYRLNGTYFRKDLRFSNQCTNCELADGEVTDYGFKFGFEKSINYAKVQPYIGADIGFRANHFTGEVKTVNPLSTQSPYNVDVNKNGIVMAPIIGLKINPTNNISIFAESSLDFYYSYEKQEIIQQDFANTRTVNKYNKWEFLLNPISIGIQFHLVNRN